MLLSPFTLDVISLSAFMPGSGQTDEDVTAPKHHQGKVSQTKSPNDSLCLFCHKILTIRDTPYPALSQAPLNTKIIDTTVNADLLMSII